MVPSQNHYFDHVFCYGGCGGESFGLVMNRLEGLRSEFLASAPMAENDLNHGNPSLEKDEGWLKLSVGSSSDQKDEPVTRRLSSLVELDLLPGGRLKLELEQDQPVLHSPEIKSPIWPISNSNSIASSSNFMPPPSFYFSNSSEINLGFRSIASSSSSSSFSSSSLIQLQASPCSDFRVIDPPRRPQSGIWFTLQASEYQAREPFLPQISKKYLRIKDGRMIVRLVMKYLAKKLGLETESEVEIRCRGQKLVPYLTLQHVRESIWSPRNAVVLLPNSSTSDYVMVLHYGRAVLRTE